RRQSAVLRPDRDIQCMSLMATMDVARMAHLHELGIVAPTDCMMPVRYATIAAATFAPSCLQEGRRESDSLTSYRAVPSVVVRAPAFGAMPGTLVRLQNLMPDVESCADSSREKNSAHNQLGQAGWFRLNIKNGLLRD